MKSIFKTDAIEVVSETPVAERLRNLRRLGVLLDAAIPIPGTNLRIGLDSLIGLIPGLGDALMAAASSYIIFESARLGASNRTLLKMLWNAGVDALIGAIPVLGDLFDIAWKANVRNLELLEREIETQKLRTRSSEAVMRQIRWLSFGLVAFCILVAVLGVAVLISALRAL